MALSVSSLWLNWASSRWPKTKSFTFCSPGNCWLCVCVWSICVSGCLSVWQAEWKMKSKHLKRDMRWQCKRHQRCGSAFDSIPLAMAPFFPPWISTRDPLVIYVCVPHKKRARSPLHTHILKHVGKLWNVHTPWKPFQLFLCAVR